MKIKFAQHLGYVFTFSILFWLKHRTENEIKHMDFHFYPCLFYLFILLLFDLIFLDFALWGISYHFCMVFKTYFTLYFVVFHILHQLIYLCFFYYWIKLLDTLGLVLFTDIQVWFLWFVSITQVNFIIFQMWIHFS